MVAPLVAAAGISAAGSLIGGITGGKGAKKAAKIQAQTAREQIAATERMYGQISALEQPTIARGDRAGGLIGGFLGTEGGDQAASALATFRGSTGYQDLMREGLGAVNAGFSAKRLGDSGAALKALQDRGTMIADQSSGQWLSGLGGLVGFGRQATGNLSGVSQNATNAMNGARQNAADASSNAALASSAAWQNAIQGLANSGASAVGGMGRSGSLGSSYGGGATFGMPTYGGGTYAFNPSSPAFGIRYPGLG